MLASHLRLGVSSMHTELRKQLSRVKHCTLLFWQWSSKQIRQWQLFLNLLTETYTYYTKLQHPNHCGGKEGGRSFIWIAGGGERCTINTNFISRGICNAYATLLTFKKKVLSKYELSLLLHSCIFSIPHWER